MINNNTIDLSGKTKYILVDKIEKKYFQQSKKYFLVFIILFLLN